jgi:hypothetical protein
MHKTSTYPHFYKLVTSPCPVFTNNTTLTNRAPGLRTLFWWHNSSFNELERSVTHETTRS